MPSRPSPLQAALALVLGLTALRLAALFVTPVELYPDEAQYWLWSRELAFGYFSKPPMVAWLIAATTAVGGDAEPWVRLSACLLHAGAALALYAVGRRLADGWTGFWAAALYSLMPGVQLSAGVIATDAPLLFFLSLALLAYTALRDGGRGRAALGLGAALGAAALSKYAALYFIGGLVLHAALSGEARRIWTARRLGLAALGLAVVLGPNLAWNAAHGFSTVGHTAANANWDAPGGFQLGQALEFLAEQLGVFGPIPFAVLIAGTAGLAARRLLRPADLMLLCLAAPPLLLVTGQAFISRANANWAAAAYAPGAVLVAVWLVRWRARGLLAATAALQGGLAAAFLLAAAQPGIADALGLSNGLKQARGWEATTAEVLRAAERTPALTAVAVDDRFYFNALAYYGRDWWGAPGRPPLRMWVREASAQNQAEAEAPLTPETGARVLAVSAVERFRPEMRADFAAVGAETAVRARVDAERTRDFVLFVGEDFRPRPR